MAFWGCSFVFNDVPCDEYDLMLYDVGGTSGSTGKFASGVSILEDKTAYRYKPFFYGVKIEDKLKFQLVFGVNESRLDQGLYFSRDELEAIATWLTGHDKYMWLYIEQDDLKQIGYHCIITGLELIEFGLVPYALKATVECDSPYAYLPPQIFEYDIAGSSTIKIFNDSGHNGYYMPKLEIYPYTSIFKIKNITDNNRELSFISIPTSVTKISVDNELEIVSFYNEGINPYKYFNFKYLRLLRGQNELEISGHGKLRIICKFPVNVGS